MTKISYFGKHNSTLGSVVPLAMFSLIKDMNLPPNIHLGKNQIFHSESDMFYLYWWVHVYFQKSHKVVGGVLSPTHDAYQKSSLIPAKHRLEMAR